MRTEASTRFDKQIYYRLIALWVLCEGVLGGLLHAVNIPFTGLIISSGAVICISLIAYYVPVRGAILKATIIVAIFKMMLSPHTPPTAYIAVFFQGLMGQLLFFNLKFFRLSCILLAVFALVESALQRIIVLTVLYGKDLWNALNEFIKKVTGESGVTNYSMMVAAGYVILHAFIGMMVGVFAGSIAWQSNSWKILHEEYIIAPLSNYDEIKSGGKKRKKLRSLFFFIWIVLVFLFLQSYLHIGKSIIPSAVALQIILRSLLIVLTWYFLISPLLSLLLKKWLSRQQIRSQNDINQVVLMLPSARHIFIKSWELSSSVKGWKRIPFFCKIVLMNTLQ